MLCNDACEGSEFTLVCLYSLADLRVEFNKVLNFKERITN